MKQVSHPICPQCGYDLFGPRSGRCPECGLSDDEILRIRKRLLGRPRDRLDRMAAAADRLGVVGIGLLIFGVCRCFQNIPSMYYRVGGSLWAGEYFSAMVITGALAITLIFIWTRHVCEKLTSRLLLMLGALWFAGAMLLDS